MNKRKRSAHCRGLSLVELLIALAVTSLLLTATMVAINASFIAYASAAEQASTQAATRMVIHRLLTLVRTSTAHGPLTAEPGATLNGNTITSDFLVILDPNDQYMRIEYRADDQELWILIDDNGNFTFDEGETAQPLLSGVSNAVFTAVRRLDSQGVWVLDRASTDLTVAPAEDNTLDVESGPSEPVRMIGSTMPRKLD